MRPGIDNRIIGIELKAQLDLRLPVSSVGRRGLSWHATVVTFFYGFARKIVLS